MKNIIVGNETRKRLLKLRKQLNLQNDNQVIEHLLNNSILLNPDVLTALLDFQKWTDNKTLNHTIVNLLWVFCEDKYDQLKEKYFS